MKNFENYPRENAIMGPYFGICYKNGFRFYKPSVQIVHFRSVGTVMTWGEEDKAKIHNLNHFIIA